MAVAIRPPLSGWLGGKSRLSKQIIDRIPKHKCYVEPFAGGAWVFFRKVESKVEVLNDINGEAVNLYRVIRFHLEEFIRYFKWILVSREEFNRFKKMRPETMTDIQRAVRFYYLQKTSFSGRIGSGATFGTATTGLPRLNLLRIEEDLSAAHLRLCRCFIENEGYDKVIKRYDRKHTFFYIDPPYYDCENDYGKDIFNKRDFQKLASQLEQIKGKFLLSLNDLPETREIFKSFNLEAVKVTYSCSRTSRPKASELFITNY